MMMTFVINAKEQTSSVYLLSREMIALRKDGCFVVSGFCWTPPDNTIIQNKIMSSRQLTIKSRNWNEMSLRIYSSRKLFFFFEKWVKFQVIHHAQFCSVFCILHITSHWNMIIIAHTKVRSFGYQLICLLVLIWNRELCVCCIPFWSQIFFPLLILCQIYSYYITGRLWSLSAELYSILSILSISMALAALHQSTTRKWSVHEGAEFEYFKVLYSYVIIVKIVKSSWMYRRMYRRSIVRGTLWAKVKRTYNDLLCAALYHYNKFLFFRIQLKPP